MSGSRTHALPCGAVLTWSASVRSKRGSRPIMGRVPSISGILTRNRAAQRLARDFGQNVRVLGRAGMIRNGFEHRAQVTNRHAFAKQMSQDAHHAPER